MLKASSSTPTVDTDKAVQEQVTPQCEEPQTQDVDNELSYEEE